MALLGGIGAATSVLVDRRPWCWPLLTGTLWVGQEALRDGSRSVAFRDGPLTKLLSRPSGLCLPI